MRMGSLFSGCGMFDLAFRRAGFDIAWQCEIDATARAVLARHFPDVPRHNDVCEVGAHNLAPVHVVVGGFPCQDVSVAGKREGITGERSGLFYELVRVAVELRSRFLVWENVPGLFSAFTRTADPPDAVEGREWEVDETSDFEAVLSHLAERGFHGGWRVLDARHFGVPQSRRRIFGVFSRDRADAGRCAEILSLSTGVRRDSAPCREAQPRTAAGTEGGAGGAGERGAVFTENRHSQYREADTSCAQRTGGGGLIGGSLAVFGGAASGERRGNAALSAKAGTRQDFDTENLVAYQCHGNNVGPAGTFRSGNGGVTGGVPFVFQADDYANGTYEEADVARPLTTSADRSRSAPLVACVRTSQQSSNGMGVRTDGVAGSVTSGDQPQAVCVTVPVTHTLTAKGADAGEDGTGRGTPIVTFRHKMGGNDGGVYEDGSTCTLTAETQPAVANLGAVRRLTPVECERLMGLPDDWTRYRADGTEISDGPRYRLCGNGVVVPVAEWLARRMFLVLQGQKP